MKPDKSPYSLNKLSYGWLIGALFGAFGCPALWMISLHLISLYYETPVQISNTLYVVPLGIGGGIIFGTIGMLIEYLSRRREGRKT